MYCVIQRIKNKKPNPYGARKEFIVESHRSNLYGQSRTKYSYRYSEERFERPIRDAYKIVIHQSYREAGKVHKRQWVICTMSYYSLLDSWPGDHIQSKLLKMKLSEMAISEAELWNLVYEKLDPIVEKIKREFQQTDEYRAEQEQRRIRSEYHSRKMEFEKKYGDDTYDFCYDLYGELRKPELLERLKKNLREREEFFRGYQNTQGSNYDHSDFFQGGGSYSALPSNTYTDDEKRMLKQIYRQLSKAFHPDITKDDGEMMKLINKIKEGWGI